MKTYQRSIKAELETLVLARKKMLFLSGPRQCGKTTLAKSLIADQACYFTWDDPKTKLAWIKGPDHFAEKILSNANTRIVLDEFHKNKKWKNQLKAFFDKYGDKIEIILTGSAQLNFYRKGVDSLLGRFIHFHLHPFSLSEVCSIVPMSLTEFKHLLSKFDFEKTTATKIQTKAQQLFDFGGFPEPFAHKDPRFLQVWSQSRLELLVRQDIPDVAGLLATNQVDVLALLLPEKIGSVLSVQSLREDLDVAHTTVTRWLHALSLVYFHFDVLPYTKNISRSLKKDRKIYLYDWSVIDKMGPRFENMVAGHLKKWIEFYKDSGQSDLALGYLRDKDQNEVDFVVIERDVILFSVEAKLSELNLDKTFIKFQKKKKFPHFQIVKTPNILRRYREENACVISFDLFFQRMP